MSSSPPGLQVVALISGGKDSLFSTLHCQRNGHRVIALGNLYPPPADGEELDSHFYQTVGHAVVPLYAEALGLPLYRQEIRGTNVDSAKVYSIVHKQQADANDQEDEIESLVPLLNCVKAAHPSLNAVCTGAILSDYQRTRVESVALRLGLTPLAYLWQFPRLPPHVQTSLLDDMRAIGQDSRIIKVSSGGLHREHLWQNISDGSVVRRLARDFARLSSLDGGKLEIGSVLGEGGEFETLAIEGPSSLWRKKIIIEHDQRHEVKGDAGSWSLSVSSATLADSDSAAEASAVRVPDLLDSRFADIKKQLENSIPTTQAQARIGELQSSAVPQPTESSLDAMQSRIEVSTWQIKSSEHELSVLNMVAEASTLNTTAQTAEIMDRLERVLQEHNLDLSQVSLSIILLRTMADFVSVNKAYASYFERPSPPARVTVSCGEEMLPGRNVMLSVLAHHVPWSEREGLHVQSRSYWAPANIGPYSQAISVPHHDSDGTRHVFVAGQIPLRPASMEMVSDNFTEQALLSLQHLWRVGQALRVHWWHAGAIAFISSCSGEEARQRALVIDQCWKLAHARHDTGEPSDGDEGEDEVIDIAELSLRGGWGNKSSQVDLTTPLWPLPDWNLARGKVTSGDMSGVKHDAISPCFTVQVESLPRAAQVEWWSQGSEFKKPLRHNSDFNYHVFSKVPQQDALDAVLGAQQAEGLVEMFVTTGMSGNVLELARQCQAMVIPCKGILSADHASVDLLIRTRG